MELKVYDIENGDLEQNKIVVAKIIGYLNTKRRTTI
jgi:hypothetical protein